MFIGKKRIVIVSGVRPNIPKVAPLIRELRKHPDDFDVTHIYSGQHFSPDMSDALFTQFGIEPDVHHVLDSSEHILPQLRTNLVREFQRLKPDVVLVIGDVTTALQASIAADTVAVPLMHIEGYTSSQEGLRESAYSKEIDRIADVSLTTTVRSHLKGIATMVSERKTGNVDAFRGVAVDAAFDPFRTRRVRFVGNLMADCIRSYREEIGGSKIMETLGIKDKQFIFASIHRDVNVDNKDNLTKIAAMLSHVPKDTPIIWPVHPRTEKMLAQFGLDKALESLPNLKRIPPLPYFDAVHLTEKAKAVVTDSGGSQGECSILDTPCLLLLDRAYDRELVINGTVIPIGLDVDRFKTELERIVNGNVKHARPMKGWDGKAAEHIVKFLKGYDYEAAWRRIAEKVNAMTEAFERQPGDGIPRRVSYAPSVLARPDLIAKLLKNKE